MDKLNANEFRCDPATWDTSKIWEYLKTDVIKFNSGIPLFTELLSHEIKAEASGIIENMLIRLPMPCIYLSEKIGDNDGIIYECVDGFKRLTALWWCMHNIFEFTHMKYYPEFDGLTYKDLGRQFQRRIEQYPWSVNILSCQMSDKAKEDAIRRIEGNNF